MKLQSPLAKVRGLGSAKNGTYHFLNQRLTALALIPLILWIMISLVRMTSMDHQTVILWMSSPLNSVLVLMFLLALYYHALLGVQVVIEDYIHIEWQKLSCIILTKFLVILTGLASALAVLKVFLGL